MPTYSIGELAREFEITPRTIRFYEDQGLLSPRRVGAGARQRSYSHRDRARLKLTLRGKRLGLSLSEIRDLIDMYDSPSDTVPQLTRFLEVLERHRLALESQLRDLNETLAEIHEHERRTRELLAQAQGSRTPRVRKSRPATTRSASR
ncbi:MAG: MerR family DNA-binding transcriptional regulator [Betaproteobacteria bacterium]|nr:MerR family DNA-binding transcriptional regulator [Betaproteobacteria bacterium]